MKITTRHSSPDDTPPQSEPRGIIWKLDRFAIHDGPGIRTNIYFKGCNLRCRWCSNPEGQRPKDQLGFLAAKCDGCGRCYDACPRGLIRPGDGPPIIDFQKCDLCGNCIEACSPGALFVYGSAYTLPQIMDIIERDRHSYRKSGGGITCTGGEPLLQSEFVSRLLTACHDVGIHTVVETCGHVDKEAFRKSLEHIDWLFFDLKHVDAERHRELTGQDNALILDNLRTAAAFCLRNGRRLVIRQVVVPGLNDGPNIDALARTASELPHLDAIELLPFHNYGMHKYATLGRDYRLETLEPPPSTVLEDYRQTVESYGITCRIGGL